MTKQKVVTTVREYIMAELEAKKLDIDDLNVSALNKEIRESLDALVESASGGLSEIEDEQI